VGVNERQCHLRPHVRDAVILQQHLDAGHLVADERSLGDHQRLMPVADVIREQPPLRRCLRLDHESRLEALAHFDDRARLVEHETVAGPQDTAPRQRRTELKTTIGTPPPARFEPFFPSKPILSRAHSRADAGSVSSRCAASATGRALNIDMADWRFQNRKYRGASGRTSAGSHRNSSPSALTSYESGSTSISGSASIAEAPALVRRAKQGQPHVEVW
jgi:hypothetical protein